MRYWIFLFIMLPSLAAAKNLYVNNSGSPVCSDSTTYANNSSSSPWCTIGRAAWGSTSPGSANSSQAAAAGDVVNITAGTYTTIGPNTTCNRWNVALNPANSGTAGNPITFLGIGTVNIYLDAGYAGPTIGADSRNYIVWNNVRIDEQVAQGVSCPDTGPVVFHETTGSKLLNSTVRGTYQSWADNYNAIRTEAADALTIANNTLTEITGAYGHNDAAIMLYDTGNSIFENNTIKDSVCGIYVKGSHSYPQWPQTNNIFRQNWLENLSNKAILSYSSNGSRFYQNIIKNSPYGIRQYGDAVNSDIVIANNTFISTGGGLGLSVYGDGSTLSNFRFFNNIMYGSYDEAMNIGDTVLGTQSYEHNLYYGFNAFGSVNGQVISFSTWQSTHNKDNASPAGVNSNPLFVDTTNYKLQSGSPARTLGVDILDLDGDGSTADIIPAGAYVTGNEVIGVNTSASITLSRPTNFRIIP